MQNDARFELEQAIISCGSVNDDIELLLDALCGEHADKERIVNALLGMRELHEMRCQRTFDIFSAMIRDGLIT